MDIGVEIAPDLGSAHGVARRSDGEWTKRCDVERPNPTALASALRALVDEFELADAEPAASIVVAVPAGISCTQRSDLVRACQRLGLQARFIYRSTALALAHVDLNGGRMLVIDVAGERCEVAVVETCEGLIHAGATAAGSTDSTVALIHSVLRDVDRWPTKLNDIVVSGAEDELFQRLRTVMAPATCRRVRGDQVVHGAARFSELTRGTQRAVLVESTVASLSWQPSRDFDGQLTPVLRRGTALPATARFDVTDGFVLFEGEARYAGDCSEVAVPSISGPTVEIRCDENGVLTITTPERRSHDGGTPWEVLGISPSPDRDVIYRAFARKAAQAYGSDTTALDTLWQAYIRAFELRLEIPPPRAPRYHRLSPEDRAAAYALRKMTEAEIAQHEHEIEAWTQAPTTPPEPFEEEFGVAWNFAQDLCSTIWGRDAVAAAAAVTAAQLEERCLLRLMLFTALLTEFAAARSTGHLSPFEVAELSRVPGWARIPTFRYYDALSIDAATDEHDMS